MALFSTSTTRAPAPGREETRQRMEDIRRTMTDLASSCGGRASAGLAMRIHYAPDIQSLWFMRSELMALLAVARGEAVATETVRQLGAMFTGLLPEAMCPRATSLGSSGGEDLPLR